MPYWECDYHLVWATKDRAEMLLGERLIIAERSIRASCRDQGAVVHAVGMMPDHVHLAVAIPPRIAVAELVRIVKGSSSHLLNRTGTGTELSPFAWQPEYGVLAFGRASLPKVVAYVVNQPFRHGMDDLIPKLERLERQRRDPNATLNQDDTDDD